jgi:cobalt-zinc-cadmium efflux system membrane fusion protein
MTARVSIRKIVPWAVVGILLLGAVGVAFRGFEEWESPAQTFDPEHDPGALVTLAPGQTDTVQFAPNALTKMGYRLATVEPAPPPPPLKLQGRVDLDSDSSVRIKARFAGGRVVEIGRFEDGPSDQPKRALRYGDHVHKDQVLAVVWSTEVGAKKSELVDALSKLHTTQDILKRLESAEEGAIAQRAIIDANRDYQQAMVAVEDARRTLLSWGLLEKDIDVVYSEAKKLENRRPHDATDGGKDSNADLAVEKSWANTEVRSPIDGRILEKNFSWGQLVDPSDDLFKIADTSHIRILARVYEEDLPTLRHVPPEKRRWKIDLKSDPFDEPVSGAFEIVGGIIDPADHTGTIMGTLDNSSGRMNLGQFVTAAIDLDADPAMVAVPTKSVIEDGSLAAIFVQDNSHPDEFTRHLVAVTSRMPSKVCIRSEPNEAERAAGATPLKLGERVLASGVIELNNELALLKAAQPHVEARVRRANAAEGEATTVPSAN